MKKALLIVIFIISFEFSFTLTIHTVTVDGITNNTSNFNVDDVLNNTTKSGLVNNTFYTKGSIVSIILDTIENTTATINNNKTMAASIPVSLKNTSTLFIHNITSRYNPLNNTAMISGGQNLDSQFGGFIN